MSAKLRTACMKLRVLLKSVRGQSDLAHLKATGLVFGHNLHIGGHVIIDSSHRHLISLGDDVTIAPRVHILAHDASTKRGLGLTRVGLVEIGDRVFLGAGVIILPGVTIGADSIVGAGSVVSRDIPAGSVASGVPATVRTTTAEFLQLRRQEVAATPNWVTDEWIAGKGLTLDRGREMATALSSTESRIGYVI